jgi:hypothetical protein
MATAGLRIENSTNRAHDYLITVTFLDNNVQVGAGVATVPGVAPHGSGQHEVIASINGTKVSFCRIASVDRT